MRTVEECPMCEGRGLTEGLLGGPERCPVCEGEGTIVTSTEPEKCADRPQIEGQLHWAEL